MFSGALDHAPLPGDSRVPPGARRSASPAGAPPVGAPPFDSSTTVSRAQRQVFRLFFFFGVSWHGA